MKRKLKRTIAALSAITMLSTTATVLPEGMLFDFGTGITASAEQSGSGWSFDEETGTLTITTNGGITAWKNSVTDKTLIQSVKIQAGVSSIGNSAFSGCTNLISIEIPDSVTSIGLSAFSACSSLISIEIPNNVTSISGNTFNGCLSLTSITIPDGVTYIGSNAFSKCSSLKSITIPNGVTSIGQSTFIGCSSLTSIEIPNSVTSIDGYAFYNCTNLMSITISDGVTSIGDSAFYGCSSLTSIEIPNSVTSVGNHIFRNCSKLKSITISDNVTSIGNSAFEGCSSLESIAIPDGVTSIGSAAFNGCSSLTSIEIPNSITSVGNYTFRKCSKLDSIVCPDGLDVSNTEVSGNTSKVEYIVTDDGVTITNITLGNDKTNVEIPDSINGINVIGVDESVRDKVSESGHTHTGGTATCTQKAVCSICGNEYGELIHNLTKTDAVEPTCTEIGNITFWHCSDCDKYFSNEDCTNEIMIDDTVISAKGHTLTTTAEKAPTCTENGNTAYWYCTECDKYFSDEACENEITLADTVLTASGHSYVDGKCTKCGAFENGIGAHLEGYSLSLDGNIGVNFYMELDESVIADENAYMQFTLPNGETSKVLVSDAKQQTVDGNTYYVFSCEVNAKEMTDTITAQIITLDKEGEKYTYSVEEYIQYIREHSSEFDEKTIGLVDAMADYGDYAKAYFSKNELIATPEMNNITADTLASYEKQTSGELPDGIIYYGSSLLLESNTTVRHYFKAADGTDVSAYGFNKKGGYYYKEITGISADKLGTAQSIAVDGYNVSYSPLSYAYAVLNSDSADESLKNLVKALYLYEQAAEAYKN